MVDRSLPDVFFGTVDEAPADWRAEHDPDDTDDDELLDATPADVIGMLGFDPLELERSLAPELWSRNEKL